MRQPQAMRHMPTSEHPCYLGIDVGSITVEAVALGGETILFADYRHHNADVRAKLVRPLSDIAESYPGLEVCATTIGSDGLAAASTMGTPFAQEVIAGTESTRRLHPEADVVTEFDGGDAKLIYLHPTLEQRMNGAYADGTGTFIDQMMTLLKTDASDLNELVAKYTQLYPIASHCGVFTESDIQPLINQGAAHKDLVASIFVAVTTQAIVDLAYRCPTRGIVMSLGGPLHFLPELRRAHEELLPKTKALVAPGNAQLCVAVGATLLAECEQCRALTSSDLKDRDKDVQLTPEFVDTLVTATITAEST